MYAQYNLGTYYANGCGIPQSWDLAAYWFGLSAEQGYAEAQRSLADCYEKGRGVPKDLNRAAQLLRQANGR